MFNSFSSEAMPPKKGNKKGDFPVEEQLISSSKGTRKRKHPMPQPEKVMQSTPSNIDYKLLAQHIIVEQKTSENRNCIPVRGGICISYPEF
jgi:hypothetical protein